MVRVTRGYAGPAYIALQGWPRCKRAHRKKGEGQWAMRMLTDGIAPGHVLSCTVRPPNVIIGQVVCLLMWHMHLAMRAVCHANDILHSDGEEEGRQQ